MKADDQIRKIASQHKVPVDFGALWEQLEQHVPTKRKKRVVLWPYYGGVLAILIGVAVWMYDYAEGAPVATSGEQTVAVASAATVPVEIGTYTASTTRSKIQSVVSPEAHESSVEKLSQRLIKSKVQLTTVPHESVARAPLEPKDAAALGNTYLQPIAQGLKPESTSSLFAAAETGTELTPDDLLTKDVAELAVEALPIKQLEDKLQSTETDEDAPGLLAAPTILKAKRPKQFALMMTFGAGYGSMQLSGKSVEPLVLDRANAAESAMENLTVGLAVQQRLSSRWSLNYGLSYGRFVSKIEWQSAQVVPKDAVGVEKIIIDPAGMVSSVPGVVNNKVYQIRANRWFTYHHTFDLPLSVSYRVLQSGRHRFSADAGILLQLYSSVNGAYVSDMGFLEKFSAANSPYARMGIGWTGGLTWERSCSRSYSLLFGLRGTSRTFYRTENLVQYQKDMLTLNVMAGIKRIF